MLSSEGEAEAALATDRVERDEVPVMFVRADADEVGAIQDAWRRLETQLGELRGRKFFGTFDPGTNEYRACVQMREGESAVDLGFAKGVLAGGAYLRARLRGEPPAVYDRIGPTFGMMAEMAILDETRPSIEFYRRRDEIDLLLAVKV